MTNTTVVHMQLTAIQRVAVVVAVHLLLNNERYRIREMAAEAHFIFVRIRQT